MLPRPDHPLPTDVSDPGREDRASLNDTDGDSGPSADAQPPSNPFFLDGDHGKRVLGHLINISGKMRMLSHRAVMALTIAASHSTERKRFLTLAQVAVADFDAILNIIRKGDEAQKIPVIFSDKLRDLLEGPDHQYGKLIAKFRRQAREALGKLEKGHELEPETLIDLADLVATSLLPALNEIVETYSQELNSLVQAENTHTRQAAVNVGAAATEISVIGVRVQSIALNALIEANKSSAFGRGFAVIANEIKALSVDVQKAAKKAQDNADILAP